MGSVNKAELLGRWGQHIAVAAGKGQLTAQPCHISKVLLVNGPRAGAVLLHPDGLGAGPLLKALRRSDCAALRAFVPWQFDGGKPQAYMAGRYIRCECPWPKEWARTMIRLTDLNNRPAGDGRFAIGMSETGATVIPSLCDRTPHFLLAGTTGSGKSVALQSILIQLSLDPDNELVLIDGKQGESLRPLEHLPGVLGPVATEIPEIRAALAYAVQVMRQRGEGNGWTGRVVVAIDEIQEIITDPTIADLLRRIAAQGRSRAVHALVTTQHPTTNSFGHPATRRNLSGKVALLVQDADASRVATGCPKWPRADYLSGCGDAYAIGPGTVHRVQVAYVDGADFAEASNGHDWRFQRWPDFDPEAVGRELPAGNAGAKPYTGDEVAVSVVAAAHSEGRPSLLRRLEDADLGKPGTNRARRLLALGRDAHNWLQANGFSVCRTSESVPDPTTLAVPKPPVRVAPSVW